MAAVALATLALAGCEVGSTSKPKTIYRAPVPGNSGVVAGANTAEVAHALSVTVTVKDKGGYGIPNVVPTITAVNAAGSSTGITSGGCNSTDSKGVTTCTLQSSVADTYTVKVVTPVAQTGNSVTFYQVPRSIAFVQQPACASGGCVSAAAGVGNFATLPTVQIKDAAGVAMLASTTLASSLTAGAFGNVSLTLSGGSGTLTGTTTAVPAAAGLTAGLADFTGSGLSVDLAGSAYTLIASYTDPTAGTLSTTSSSFAVIAGAATQLAFTTQPSSTASTGANLGTMPVVQFEDAQGNAVAKQGCVVTMSLNNAGASDSILGTLSETTSSTGAASYAGSNLRITTNTANKVFTLTATSTASGVTCPAFVSPNSSNITVDLAGQPAQISIFTGASASPLNKVWTTQPVIRVLDSNGNLVTSDNDTVVTVAASAAAPAAGTLVGSSSIRVAGGVATFSGLLISGSAVTDATTYTLSFTAVNAVTGLDTTATPITSPLSINKNGLVPAKLAFDVQPQAVAIKQPMSSIIVETRDSNGFYCFNDQASLVKLVFVSGPAGAHMYQNGVDLGAAGSATLPVTVLNGQATFPGIGFDIAGNYSLSAQFNATAVGAATSNTFAISSFTTANKLHFVQQPCDNTATQPSCNGTGAGNGVTIPWQLQPKVEILDAFGNRVTNDNSTVVTVDCVAPLFASPTPACALQGTVSVTAVNGVADFTGANLRTNNPAGAAAVNGIVIRAQSSPSLSQDMSGTFNDN